MLMQSACEAWNAEARQRAKKNLKSSMLMQSACEAWNAEARQRAEASEKSTKFAIRGAQPEAALIVCNIANITGLPAHASMDMLASSAHARLLFKGVML